jgi:hypothetical protein
MCSIILSHQNSTHKAKCVSLRTWTTTDHPVPSKTPPPTHLAHRSAYTYIRHPIRSHISLLRPPPSTPQPPHAKGPFYSWAFPTLAKDHHHTLPSAQFTYSILHEWFAILFYKRCRHFPGTDHNRQYHLRDAPAMGPTYCVSPTSFETTPLIIPKPGVSLFYHHTRDRQRANPSMRTATYLADAYHPNH